MCALTVQFEPLMLLEKEEFSGSIKLKLCKLSYVQTWDDTLGNSSPLSWRCKSPGIWRSFGQSSYGTVFPLLIFTFHPSLLLLFTLSTNLWFSAHCLGVRSVDI